MLESRLRVDNDVSYRNGVPWWKLRRIAMTDRDRKEGAVAQDAAPASESTDAELSDRELESVAGGTGRRIRIEDRTSDFWENRYGGPGPVLPS